MTTRDERLQNLDAAVRRAGSVVLFAKVMRVSLQAMSARLSLSSCSACRASRLFIQTLPLRAWCHRTPRWNWCERQLCRSN